MALPGKRETETFRDADLIFKNFAGEARQYNAAGDRNFSVVIGEEDARELEAKGWNVKPLKRRDEDDAQNYHLKVAVNFANKPPRCWLISSGGRTMLGETFVSMLDQLDSSKVDLVITPYDWEMGGKTGRKAYLESLFFHMYESDLELEYADMPQLSSVGENLAIESGARQAYDIEGEEA